MQALARAIEAQAARAPAAFYRLVLVVGPPGAGKTAALRTLQRKQGWPLLNLNAELSEQLLELSNGQRRLKAAELVNELVAGQDAEVTLLDNIGILFHPALQQDPLRVLQRAARNRTVVATWQGEVADKTLTYAAPDHPEFRRHQNPEVLLVRTSAPVDSIEVAA